MLLSTIPFQFFLLRLGLTLNCENSIMTGVKTSPFIVKGLAFKIIEMLQIMCILN